MYNEGSNVIPEEASIQTTILWGSWCQTVRLVQDLSIYFPLIVQYSWFTGSSYQFPVTVWADIQCMDAIIWGRHCEEDEGVSKTVSSSITQDVFRFPVAVVLSDVLKASSRPKVQRIILATFRVSGCGLDAGHMTNEFLIESHWEIWSWNCRQVCCWDDPFQSSSGLESSSRKKNFSLVFF